MESCKKTLVRCICTFIKIKAPFDAKKKLKKTLKRKLLPYQEKSAEGALQDAVPGVLEKKSN